MGNVTKHEAMTGTLKIVKHLGDGAREEIIKQHREWKLSPAQSQTTLSLLAQHTLELYQQQKRKFGVARARQFLDFKTPELCTHYWLESQQLDWMSDLMRVMPNIASSEFIEID